MKTLYCHYILPLWPSLREGMLSLCLALGANQAANNRNFLALMILCAATFYQMFRMMNIEPQSSPYEKP